MAGLLDFFGNGWDDPKSNAVMALAGGLLDGDFAGGMKGYSQVMAGAGDAKFKRAMQQAQMDNLASEIDARKLAGVKYADQQKLIESVFGGKGIQNKGTGVGEVPFPTGGMSTENGVIGAPLQTSQGSINQGGSVLGNMRPDDVARLKLGGLDLTEIYKYANDPQKLDQGATYKDRNTGLERFMPKVGEGMMPNQQGVYGFAPGYAEAQAKFEGDKTRAVEGAKSQFGMTTVTRPDGSTYLAPNDIVLGAARGQAPQQPMQQPAYRSQAPASSEAQMIANGMGGLNGLPTTARGGNVSMKSTPAEMDKPRILQDAFAQVTDNFNVAQKAGDSAGMRRAQADLEGIRSEFAKIGGGRSPSLAPNQAPNTAPQSAPSFGLQLQSLSEKERISAENDAYKTKLVEQAKADIVPTQARQASISSANDALSVIDKALAHPGLGVATGLSGVVDPRNYIPGQVGKDYQSIQKQLEGKAFLSAFEQLKGGGAISEKEGEKAQQAIARMSTSQSEKEYRQGLKDYREVIQTGLSRLNGKESQKQEQKTLQDYGYKTPDDVLRDARNTLMRNPQARGEVEKRLKAMGLSLGGQ